MIEEKDIELSKEGRICIKPTSGRQRKLIICDFCYKKPQTFSEAEKFSFKMGAWSEFKLIDQIACPHCKGSRGL